MRGVSTVLDTGLFLLLVGAAVLTLAVPVADLPGPDADAADGTAEVLAASTADLRYSLAPGAARADESIVAFPHTGGPAFQRTAHGTLADHLAAATTRTVTVDGERVTHTGDGYRRTVAAAVRNATRGRDHLARVRAVWEPYPGASVRSEVVVGPRPPPTADVHAARLTVDSGYPDAREGALDAADGGFDAVGRRVATRVVEGYLPPRATRDALLGDYPVDRLTAYRYRRFGHLVGRDVTHHVREQETARANAELAAALGERFERDLRRRYDSPEAAARDVSVGTVRITVRTWSP